MVKLNDISVLILTYNEAANIGRTLDALTAFDEVIVVDSGSTDETLEIVERYPSTRIVVRHFDNHAAQWNYGLHETGISRTWVLALDADYVVSSNLVNEFRDLKPSHATAGYKVDFNYRIHGRRLRGSLYPSLIAFYRRTLTAYKQDGHTQRVVVNGRIGQLTGRIDHDDRKPLSRWLNAQQGYSRLEAEHILAQPKEELRRTDRLRRMGWPAPWLVFFYTLLVKRCILDGWAGWVYALQRTVAEALISLEIADRRLRGSPTENSTLSSPAAIPPAQSMTSKTFH